MNAISVRIQAELRQAAAGLATDPGIRASVVYGGEKVVAAGADVKEMVDNDYPVMALANQAITTRQIA